MKNFKLLSIIMILLLVLTAVSGCAPQENEETASSGDGAAEQAPAVVNTEGAIHIQIDIQDLGVVKADLYPEVAPETVANFTKLVSEGFYDGLTFHRVINGFMIQGGDPLGTGMGGSSDNVVGEFASNGFDNPLSHTKGVLSMARAGNDNDSASSQFFIVQADANFLDGDYAAFGMVTEGMDLVDAIAANTPVEDDNGTVLPENQPVIKSVTILE